jgi:hypothetical protein
VIEHTSSDTRTTEHFIAAVANGQQMRNEVSVLIGARRCGLASAKKFEKPSRLTVSNAGYAPAFFLADVRATSADPEFISVSKQGLLAPVNSSFLVSSPERAVVGTGSIIVPLS